MLCCGLPVMLGAAPALAQGTGDAAPLPAQHKPVKPSKPLHHARARPTRVAQATPTAAQRAASTAASAAASEAPTATTPAANQAATQGGSGELGAASANAVAETVTVTGQSRTSTIQHTPTAITAFTELRRNQVGVENGQDIVNLTPSASLQGDFLALRGIGRFQYAGVGTDPGIGVNIDGSYAGSTTYLNQPDILTNRIEVISGPGTVTGHNNLGGEADIYSQHPTDVLSGDIRTGGNSLGENYDQAALGFPITSTLKGRLVAAFDDITSGAQENIDLPSQRPGTGNSLILEGQLEWDPTPDLNVWVRYQNFQQHELAPYGVNAGLGQSSPYLGGSGEGSLMSQNAYFGFEPNPQFGLIPSTNPSTSDPFKTSVLTPGHADIDDDHTVTTNITYDLHWASLKFLGNYSQFSSNTLLDLSYTQQPTFLSPTGRAVPDDYYDDAPVTEHFYSDELRLSSEGTGKLQWFVGAYDYGENYQNGFYAINPGAPYLATPVLSTTTFAPAAPNPLGAFYSQNTTESENSEAVYGQIDYSILPTLRATLAFRQNWDQRTGGDRFREVYDVGGFFGDFPTAPRVGLDLTPAADNAEARASYQAQTGKIGLEWAPDPRTLAYVEVARGYQPGGFDLGAFDPIPKVQATTLMDYEVGLKKTFGTEFLVDGSVFYYDYDNLQLPLTVAIQNPTLGTVFEQSLVNAQRTRSFGGELQSTWSPRRNLHLTFVYSYLNAKFEEFSNGSGIEDTNSGVVYASLRGNTVPQSPTNKFTFSPVYVMHLKHGDLSLSGIFSYVGQEYSGVFKTSAYVQPHYVNMDIRALYQPAQTHLTAVLYARNINNSTQYIFRGPSINFPQTIQYTVNYPFVFGGELQYRF